MYPKLVIDLQHWRVADLLVVEFEGLRLIGCSKYTTGKY